MDWRLLATLLRDPLGDWLHERLSADLHEGGAPSGELERLLAHAAALVRTDPDQQLWEPLAKFLLYAGCDRLVSLGRLDLAKIVLEAVSDWLGEHGRVGPAAHRRAGPPDSAVAFDGGPALEASLSHPTPLASDSGPGADAARLANGESESLWLRERSVVFGKLGELATAQGNLPEAQWLFGETLHIQQRLAESDPANTAFQFNLGISNERLGNLAAAQGKLDEAWTYHTARHDIINRLAKSAPAKAAWQRDLSVSFSKLGDLARAQGNLPESQRLLGESLRIRRWLAGFAPANATWQRDLSVSFGKLGDLAATQGDLVEAQRLIGDAIRIQRRLAEYDPANAAWQRDLYVSYWKVADVLERQESSEAAEYWQKAHDTLASLLARGLFVSEEDQKALERLRDKIDGGHGRGPGARGRESV